LGAYELRKPRLFKEEARKNIEIALYPKNVCLCKCYKYAQAKLTCKGIQHER